MSLEKMDPLTRDDPMTLGPRPLSAMKKRRPGSSAMRPRERQGFFSSIGVWARVRAAVNALARVQEAEPMDESTFNCSHCGALYVVTVGQRGSIVEGSALCKVCEHVMMRWRTASPPT